MRPLAGVPFSRHELFQLLFEGVALEMEHLWLQLVERTLQPHNKAVRNLGQADAAAWLFVEVCTQGAEHPLVHVIGSDLRNHHGLAPSPLTVYATFVHI